MSRFIKKVSRLRNAEPQPMGFMTGAKSTEKPHMQLIASLPAERLEAVKSELESADAVIIEVSKSAALEIFKTLCGDDKAVPTGGWLKTGSNGTARKLADATCDFIIFPSSVLLSSIRKEKLGNIMELEDNVADILVRTISELPMDAVLLTGKDDCAPLTISRLMSVQRVALLVNKPLFICVPADITETELQTVWDMGISGIVIELDAQNKSRLAELKKTISGLTLPSARKKERIRPILPGFRLDTPEPKEGGEEEDE